MIDKLNSVGLPQKYDYIISNSEDGKLVGIEYIGKKEEVVIPAENTEATVFKSLGKICIVFKKAGSDTYTLTNKKKSVQVEGIHDFVAGPTFLYIQIDGEYNRENLEWCVLDKNFERVKNIGTFTLNDVATNGGARVLSGTRTNLEILDRHGKTCRIMLKDASIDEVITFGSKTKRAEKEKVESATYSFEFNLTNGKVSMTGNMGNDVRINRFTGIDKVKSSIVNLMDSKFEEDEITVQVKRHVETYKIATVVDVEAEKAKKIAKLLSRFEEFTDFSLVALLIETYTTDGLIEKIDKDFADIVEISGPNVLRGKKQYALQCINMKDMLITLLIERVSGKISYSISDKDNTKVWDVSNHNVKISNISYCIEEYGEDINKDAIKLPLSINKHKDSYGNSIENERFENIIYMSADLTFEESDGSQTDNGLAMVIYDGFTYDIKKIKARRKVSELSKTELHNKKYNTDDIVLSTRTALATVSALLDTVKPDEDEICEA